MANDHISILNTNVSENLAMEVDSSKYYEADSDESADPATDPLITVGSNVASNVYNVNILF